MIRTPRLIYGLAALLLASLAVPCFAADPPGLPSAFVADLAHKAFLYVKSTVLSSADRQRQIEGLVNDSFDVPKIASFVLGRYWQSASEAERQNFTAVFRDFMVRTYSQRFTEYNGDSFRVIGQHTESATSTVVYTEIGKPASGSPIKVEWRVVDKSGYRIVDMSVAGTSMALAQRDEYASFLERNGGDLAGLIRQLQAKMSAQRSG